MNQELDNERNKQEAIDLAKALFSIVRSDLQTLDPVERYEILCKKYPNFSRTYPIVMHYMADGRYNEKAFRRFFAALEHDPGKGIEGFIERQADYAKFLYIEESKAKHRHWDMKTANAIWTTEYRRMKDAADKIKKEEEEAKSKFAEEKMRHLEERRKELLDFISQNIDNLPDPDGDESGESQPEEIQAEESQQMDQ